MSGHELLNVGLGLGFGSLLLLGAAAGSLSYSAPKLAQGSAADTPDALALASSKTPAPTEVDAPWPQFRGPNACGIAPGERLPLHFREPRWERAVAGLAHASPVIAGGRVYVLTAVPSGIEPELKVGLYGAGDSAEDLVETEFRVSALDFASGEVIWDVLAARAVPLFGRHTKATQANSTPAYADGKLVALFGSSGLFCFDAGTGERLWTRDLGPLDCGPRDASNLHWGFASSPVIADGRVLVQLDVKDAARLAAFDLVTGEPLWHVARTDVNGWSTPTVALGAEGEQLVFVNGSRHMGAYTLLAGVERWRMGGGGGIPVPTPVVADGLVYLTSNHMPLKPSHPSKPVYAVRIDARGDLGIPGPNSVVPEAGEDGGDAEAPLPEPAPSSVAWVVEKRGNYMQTPLVYNGLVWLGYDSGVVTCLDASTGAEHYRERINAGQEGFTGSPVAGAGRVYFTSEEGEVVVLAARPEFEVLARSSLGEVCLTTPAVAEGAFVFRLRGSVQRFDPAE